MIMTDKYSLVFQPSEELIKLIRMMKRKLAEEIGWYNSKNALAHITIAEFKASIDDIPRIHKQITRCSERFKPVVTQFSSFGTYPNGAFFLEVDQEAKKILIEYGRQLTDELRLTSLSKSNDPHLSIARKLDFEKIEKAFKLFNTPDISTTIGFIALRKLNTIRKQYDILHCYPFLDLEDTRAKQLTLF